VVDAPLNVPERSDDPTAHRRPALGYALVLAAVALWSVNATVAPSGDQLGRLPLPASRVVVPSTVSRIRIPSS